MDEGKIIVGGEDGSVEKDEPDVDSEIRLWIDGLSGPGRRIGGSRVGGSTYHAVLGTLYAFVNDLPSRTLESSYEIPISGTLPNNLLQRKMAM